MSPVTPFWNCVFCVAQAQLPVGGHHCAQSVTFMAASEDAVFLQIGFGIPGVSNLTSLLQRGNGREALPISLTLF